MAKIRCGELSLSGTYHIEFAGNVCNGDQIQWLEFVWRRRRKVGKRKVTGVVIDDGIRDGKKFVQIELENVQGYEAGDVVAVANNNRGLIPRARNTLIRYGGRKKAERENERRHYLKLLEDLFFDELEVDEEDLDDPQRLS